MSKKFEPKPYQKNLFHELAKNPKKVSLLSRSPSYIGIDIGQKDGDKTTIVRARIRGDGKTKLIFDEYSELPNYKWWRNPIKWYKWRRTWKIVEKASEKWTKFNLS